MEESPVTVMKERPATLMIMNPLKVMEKAPVNEMKETPNTMIKEKPELGLRKYTTKTKPVPTSVQTVPMTIETYVKHQEVAQHTPAPLKEPAQQPNAQGQKAPFIVMLPVDETYHVHIPFDKKVSCHCEKGNEDEMKKQVLVMKVHVPKEIPSHYHVPKHIPVHPANYHL
jgi:hypothetical protein